MAITTTWWCWWMIVSLFCSSSWQNYVANSSFLSRVARDTGAGRRCCGSQIGTRRGLTTTAAITSSVVRLTTTCSTFALNTNSREITRVPSSFPARSSLSSCPSWALFSSMPSSTSEGTPTGSTSIATMSSTSNTIGYLNASDAAALDVELMSPDIGGYTLEQLMELAGMAVAEAVMEVVPAIDNSKNRLEKKKSVLILCGPGNNGGDGLVAARHLYFFGGYDCTIVYPKRSSKQPHYSYLVKQCENVGISVVDDLSDINDGESTSMGDYDVIIDALFGFSFHGEPREPFATMLQQVMAAQRKADNPPVVVSVDVPSGWNVDEGDVNNSGFVPDVLVSLTTPKLCAQKFITGRHFVGGRFLPPDLATKYKVRMPPYPGISQVMEIPITAVGENNEDQITKQKKVLRKEIRTKMKALSKEEIQEQSVKVWKKVMELHAYKSASSVGIFLSMPSGEINTDFIIEDCIRQGKEIWVPEVGPNFENPDMDLRKVILPDDDGDSSADESKKLFHKVWPTNKWNIPEPPSDMPHVIAKPGDIDLLIVPGLGFDTAGNRLGQGKGYYDRFIAKMNDAASHTKAMPLVAVGLTPQLVLPEHSRIPVASYDKPMDVVIFPDRIIASTDDTNTGEMTTNSNSSRSSRSAERETLSDESWRHEYAAYLAKKYETDNKTSSCVETTHAPSNEQLKIDKDDNDVLGAEKTKPERWEDEYAAHCAEKEERLAKEDAKLREAMRDRG